MKYLLIIAFLVESCLMSAQDSVKVVTGFSVGICGGVNNTFMGHSKRAPTVFQSTYSQVPGAALFTPMVGAQVELYSGSKRYKCKVGLASYYYESKYRYTQEKHYVGMDYSYDEVIHRDFQQRVLVEQLRLSFFRKFSSFNVGLGISGNAEIRKRQRFDETYYEAVNSYGVGTVNRNVFGTDYKHGRKLPYFSFALLTEVPLKKINSELTFRYDWGPLIRQNFILLGFNKKFVWKTKIKVEKKKEE